MPKARSPVAAHARHKKILNITKGQRGSKHSLFRRANEAMLASLRYQSRDRHNRKREMRRLWITRINAGARLSGMSYSRFVQGLRLAGVDINRKILADMAIHDPSGFADVVEVARAAIAAAEPSAGEAAA